MYDRAHIARCVLSKHGYRLHNPPDPATVARPLLREGGSRHSFIIETIICFEVSLYLRLGSRRRACVLFEQGVGAVDARQVVLLVYELNLEQALHQRGLSDSFHPQYFVCRYM